MCRWNWYGTGFWGGYGGWRKDGFDMLQPPLLNHIKPPYQTILNGGYGGYGGYFKHL